MRRGILRLALCLAFLPAVVAGCGGDDEGSGGTNPTEIVPARTLVYFEAEIDPDGEQEEAVRAIIEKFPGEGEPQERIARLIDEALRQSDQELDYSDDIEPWLGERAGFFLSEVGPGTADGAAVIATDDEDKARDTLEKVIEGDEQEHEGVTLRVKDDQNAGAIVEGFVVIGTRGGVEDAIEASKEDALDGADRYDEATEPLPDERLATFYVDFQRFAQLAGPQGAAFGQFFGGPLAGSIDAEDDAIVFEAVGSGGAFSFLGGGTELVEQLPADSWAASGQPKFGETLSQIFGAGGGGITGPGAIGEQFERQTGLDLQRDVLGWMGDLAFFVRGSTEEDVNGAAVIEATDPQAAARGIDAIGRAIERQGSGVEVERFVDFDEGGGGFQISDPDLPEPVLFVYKGERAAIAYGEGAAADALGATSPLGDQQRYQDAIGALGEGYTGSLFLDAAPLLQLVENIAGADPGYQQARPYLEPFDFIVGGTKQEGDAVRTRTLIKLK